MSKVRIYNKTLCPDIWAGMRLNAKIRVTLLQIAKDFYEKTEFKAPIRDIYFMGSVANYNWSPESDIDIHVLIDFKQLQMPEDTTFQAVKTASSKWNEEHDIKIKGHEVEVNIQDVAEIKPHVTGIFSLMMNTWIRTPSRQSININRSLIVNKYHQLKSYIDQAINSGDNDYMKAAKEYLDSYRQYGLDLKGELSNENIVFKMLRNKGVLKKLKDTIVDIYDKQMSIPEGYGAGIPETDRLHISGERWRIRWKDAPKTPRMKKEGFDSTSCGPRPEATEGQPPDANFYDNEIRRMQQLEKVSLKELLLTESPEQKTLKKHKVPLTDEERKQVMDAGAVWHHGPNVEETPAIWKAAVKGKSWYICNTHRAVQIKSTLKGAIKAFDFIKTTS